MGIMEGGEEVTRGGHEECIFVSVRLRPLNEKEILKNDVSDWECINDTTIIYKNANLSASERSMYPTAYTFDRAFRSDCTTRQVYEEGAREVALSVVGGINATLFAYGQTSSGKTFTMTGITEYTIGDIYDYIQKHREREFILKFSALEIYNECVRDLLSTDTTPLRLLDDPERGTIVEKLTEEVVRDWDHVVELLSVCEAQRQIGETVLNETSSRSHQIIRLMVESSAREFLGRENYSTLAATVNFVDLAGSERASQSLSAGTRLKEGCHINRSLLTLGTVIRKLSKGKNGHVPFRDSKLTRILQSSLGGNARTAIICTMSPARSHVEQSRNTLLFASCAKEVTTNAQVNVVMSEKALVKHLQRELARLESELRSPGTTVVTSDYAALLRDKDHQIEELEKEVKNLILQRDIAQSQLKDLLQLLGQDRNSLRGIGLRNYPHLRIHESPDSEHPVPDTSSLLDSPTFSCGNSRSSSEDNFIRVPDFVNNFQDNNTTPRMLVLSSNFSESESCQGWEEMDKRSSGTSEDLCKEVRCIEVEDFSYPCPLEHQSNALSITGGDKEIPELQSSPLEDGRRSASPSLKEEKQLAPIAVKEDKELVSPPLMEDEQLVLPQSKDEKELHCIDSSYVPTANSSPLQDLLADSVGSKGLSLTKSRSCNASITMTNNTPPDGSEREFIARKEGIKRKLLKFDFDVERLSREGSHPSAENVVDNKFEASNEISSNTDNVIRVDTCPRTTELHPEPEVPDNPIKESEEKSSQATKIVKDVGLDPIEDEHVGLRNWPTEFKRLQKEIIELWEACSVSLAHRTYFYLLFQGDPTDAIYMEVEMRRMIFLKDTFSRGEKTMLNGQTVSLASSMKALRRERRTLSKLMLKKFSEEERQSLFLKWGIGLDTKLRRLQLAQRLWTNTEDMNHIADSAYIVAKVVGLIEPGQHAPKEMFGLNFTPRSSSKTYSFKRSLIALL
ncbi:kinesin-like protein KIN-7E isoform X1 [Coffea arabica]|uniref:Kinesin-like protein n=2 Tax=Coffea arabica TaxID=13443 RepID=A0A6P6TIV9_COFAR